MASTDPAATPLHQTLSAYATLLETKTEALQHLLSPHQDRTITTADIARSTAHLRSISSAIRHTLTSLRRSERTTVALPPTQSRLISTLIESTIIPSLLYHKVYVLDPLGMARLVAEMVRIIMLEWCFTNIRIVTDVEKTTREKRSSSMVAMSPSAPTQQPRATRASSSPGTDDDETLRPKKRASSEAVCGPLPIHQFQSPGVPRRST